MLRAASYALCLSAAGRRDTLRNEGQDQSKVVRNVKQPLHLFLSSPAPLLPSLPLPSPPAMQPLHNISGHAAVSSHPLTAVAAVARRRYSLRDLGLEMFFSQPDSSRQQLEVAASPPFWGAASALFAFSSREQREQAVAVLAAQQDLGAALPGGREAATACSAILEVGGWAGAAAIVSAAWLPGWTSAAWLAGLDVGAGDC